MPKKTIIHMCIKLDKLLEFALKGEPTCLEHDDGTPVTEIELYKFVADEKARGYKYFCGCDNRDELGQCKGHEVLEEVSK